MWLAFLDCAGLRTLAEDQFIERAAQFAPQRRKHAEARRRTAVLPSRYRRLGDAQRETELLLGQARGHARFAQAIGETLHARGSGPGLRQYGVVRTLVVLPRLTVGVRKCKTCGEGNALLPPRLRPRNPQIGRAHV